MSRGLFRIVGHWTGGTGSANDVDRRVYHEITEASGVRVPGDLAPEANIDLRNGIYARHAGQFNTGAIGLAMAGMKGAREKSFEWGRYPLQVPQLKAFTICWAEHCLTYDIPVSRDTTVLHSEVLPRFGRGIYKWDINILPGMEAPGDPVEVGDKMRDLIDAELRKLRWKAPKPRRKRFWERFAHRRAA